MVQGLSPSGFKRNLHYETIKSRSNSRENVEQASPTRINAKRSIFTPNAQTPKGNQKTHKDLPALKEAGMTLKMRQSRNGATVTHS